MAQMDRTVGIAVVDVHKAGAYLGSTGQLEVQCTVTDGGLTLVDPDILVATPVTLNGGGVYVIELPVSTALTRLYLVAEDPTSVVKVSLVFWEFRVTVRW